MISFIRKSFRLGDSPFEGGWGGCLSQVNISPKKVSLIIFLCLIINNLQAQNKPYSLFLIGDAGDDTEQNEVHKTLQKHLEATTNGGVIFLGDNIYPRGLDGSKDAELKLLTQLNTLRNFKGDWYFMPGNHDWAKGRWKGYTNVIRQANYINKFAKDTLGSKKNKHFLPEYGLPGPTVQNIGNMVLIFNDLDWWLQRQFFHKVGKDGSYKQYEINYFLRLDSILTATEKQKKIPIFLSHHPLVDYGQHGFHRDKMFVYGLATYTPLSIFRPLGLNRAFMSEMNSARYRNLAQSMYDVLNKHKGVIAVAGHEHNLQVIQREHNLFLISGSGSKLTHIKREIKQKDCRFSAAKPGFMELIVNPDNTYRLKVWSGDDKILFEF
jgi:Calcineurin-like phosphoesterase